jgi:hypothetical protein
MAKDALDLRLQNWAWYVSYGVVGPQIDTTCRSFEKNYLPELGNLYTDQEPIYEPDQLDGDLIEQSVKGLPLQHRRILKARYVSHPYASLGQLAHHLRISTHKLELEIGYAKRRLQDILDKRTKRKYLEGMCKVQDTQID